MVKTKLEMEWLTVLALPLGPILADSGEPKITDWITIVAVIAGPILAVQAQKWVERATEEKKERKSTFLTLMRTRANIRSQEYVDAFNSVPLVFRKKNPKDDDVHAKWRAAWDQLQKTPFRPDEGEEKIQETDPEETFLTQAEKLQRALLVSLADVLNYKIEQGDIKTFYSPRRLEKETEQNRQIRKLLFQLLRGKSALKIQETPHSAEKTQPPLSGR